MAVPMARDHILVHLRDLEVALHQPDIWTDTDRLDELLHDSFIEFGRSGRIYNKADILRELPLRPSSDTLWSQDFSVAEIADGVALLTYKSADLDVNGEMSRYTLRASLWQRTARGWQMHFHQGTPTDAFARSTA